MRNDTFLRGGRGVFACITCGRSCRQTRATGDSQCCIYCYELAGWENHFSDYGELDAGEINECKDHVANAVKAGGSLDKMKAQFSLPPEVFAG